MIKKLMMVLPLMCFAAESGGATGSGGTTVQGAGVQNKPAPVPTTGTGAKTPNQANEQTGGKEGKKAPALGTDVRPVVGPTPVKKEDEVNTTHENTVRGKLGDGGPSSNAEGKNVGNMHGEKDQAPQQNATAGGPDVGSTPANASGMSHS